MTGAAGAGGASSPRPRRAHARAAARPACCCLEPAAAQSARERALAAAGPVRLRDRDYCTRCHHRRERDEAKEPCPRCGKPGFLRKETGWCGSCSRPGPPKDPPRICAGCGELRRHSGLGLCSAAAGRGTPSRRSSRPRAWPPGWTIRPPGSTDSRCLRRDRVRPVRAASLIGRLGQLLEPTADPAHPQALLERSRLLGRGRSPGSLARTLEAFFVTRAMAVPTDHAERLAAGRRQRRIDAVPDPLRPAVTAFAAACLQARERARRAGTLPRADSTIEDGLAAVRDLAMLPGRRAWQGRLGHRRRARHRGVPWPPGPRTGSAPDRLRQFFTLARSAKLILADPTRGLTFREPRGFRGPTLALAMQRELFRRWTTTDDAHPHEALTGLLALLHGAPAARTARPGHLRHRPGRASRPARQTASCPPAGPGQLAALARCLDHRVPARHRQPPRRWSPGRPRAPGNPRRPTTSATSSTRRRPAPPAARTRLAELVTTMDPKLVSAAFGMRPEGSSSTSPTTSTRAVSKRRTRAT